MNQDLTERACPVVVRRRSENTWDFLAFEHPTADLQIVKGRIEPDETPARAACRELLEESGLVASGEPELIFSTDKLKNTGAWYFFLCEVAGDLPENWAFDTSDDGGQCFQLFWHAIAEPLSLQWHPLFRDVLAVLLPRLDARLR